MRTKLFFLAVVALLPTIVLACGSGSESDGTTGGGGGDGKSDASLGTDAATRSPDGGDGGDGGSNVIVDGAVASGDSGPKDASATKDASAAPLKTDGGDCIGNGGDPMFGYEFQCQTAAALTGTPCTAGQNDCAADECCYADPASACVTANGPQCVTLTGF